MKTYDIKFKYVDYWNRAIYKVIELNVYLSDIEHLWDLLDTKETIDEYYRNDISGLTVHGTAPDDDPLGTNVKSTITLNII